jgi:hypothetical protein
MGVHISRFSTRSNTDTRSLANVEDSRHNDTEHSQYEDRDYFHKKRNYPYPLPGDPTEIDR